MEWSATLKGRIASKKNSKQIRFNRRTQRPFITSSDAYAKWHIEASAEILANHRLPKPLSGPLSITCRFDLKGKLDSDLDNMMASICDLLQDCGIIEDDKQIVHASLTKVGGYKDSTTTIRLTSFEP